MADIYITLDTLRTTSTQLKEIVDEFENAVSSSEALESDIGRPFGRSELKDQAEDFEERWDIQRDKLKDGLSDVREHVDAVIEGVEKWDAETAIALESEE